MGMDLIRGSNDYFKCSVVTWRKVLDLARSYGWGQRGTRIPVNWKNRHPQFRRPGRWDKNYFTNDGQKVTREDARRIAVALERSLKDIPDASSGSKYKTYWTEDDWIGHPLKGLIPPGEIITAENNTLNPIKYFSGTSKGMIIGLIAFCLRGAFVIL